MPVARTAAGFFAVVGVEKKAFRMSRMDIGRHRVLTRFQQK